MSSWLYAVTCCVMQRTGAAIHSASTCHWDKGNDGACTCVQMTLSRVSVQMHVCSSSTPLFERNVFRYYTPLPSGDFVRESNFSNTGRFVKCSRDMFFDLPRTQSQTIVLLVGRGVLTAPRNGFCLHACFERVLLVVCDDFG